MSDSPPDDTYDDHKLPDEPGEGAQLAGSLETGRSPFLSPFAISFATIDNARPLIFLVLTIALFLLQASLLRQRNEVVVVPRAARTRLRRALRAQPRPRPKLPQRLARRGKGGDLLKYALPN
jgi:hypothetical protein